MKGTLRPLPHLTDRVEHPWVAGRGLLPLRLGGQARAVRPGKGLGLEPADVADGRPRVAHRHGGVVGDVVLLFEGPALLRPPLALLVAAALAEAHPACAAHGLTRDPESG